MNLRKTLLSGILASSMALGGAVALGQDATPDADVEATPVATPVGEITTIEGLPLYDAQGVVVAYADVWEEDDDDEDENGVWFSITNAGESNLAEGWYGVHVHERGVCDADADPAFSSAGEHFNPTGEAHGDLNADPSHAGDLGNLEVDDEGNFEHEIRADNLTMIPGENHSLADEDGAALIIHNSEDDFETDPDGNAGEPWACAVIFPEIDQDGTPEATPVDSESTPDDAEATPAS